MPSSTWRSGSSGNGDDLRRIAVDIDEDAQQIRFAGKRDPRLQQIPARTHRMALLGCGEDAPYGVVIDAATAKFERRMARDEIIVYRVGHAYRRTGRARGRFGFI
jgi:hypothetical protein